MSGNVDGQNRFKFPGVVTPSEVNHMITPTEEVDISGLRAPKEQVREILLESSFILADDGDFLVTPASIRGKEMWFIEAVCSGVAVPLPYSLRKITANDLDGWEKLFPDDNGLRLKNANGEIMYVYVPLK